MVRKMREVRKVKKLTDGTEDSVMTLEEGSDFTVDDQSKVSKPVEKIPTNESRQFKEWKNKDMKDNLLHYFNNSIVKSEDFLKRQQEQDKKIKSKF